MIAARTGATYVDGRPQPDGVPGLYDRYGTYAAQVRCLRARFNGRGPLTYHASTVSQGFATLAAAREWRDANGGCQQEYLQQ